MLPGSRCRHSWDSRISMVALRLLGGIVIVVVRRIGMTLTSDICTLCLIVPIKLRRFLHLFDVRPLFRRARRLRLSCL